MRASRSAPSCFNRTKAWRTAVGSSPRVSHTTVNEKASRRSLRTQSAPSVDRPPTPQYSRMPPSNTASIKFLVPMSRQRGSPPPSLMILRRGVSSVGIDLFSAVASCFPIRCNYARRTTRSRSDVRLVDGPGLRARHPHCLLRARTSLLADPEISAPADAQLRRAAGLQLGAVDMEAKRAGSDSSSRLMRGCQRLLLVDFDVFVRLIHAVRLLAAHKLARLGKQIAFFSLNVPGHGVHQTFKSMCPDVAMHVSRFQLVEILLNAPVILHALRHQGLQLGKFHQNRIEFLFLG